MNLLKNRPLFSWCAVFMATLSVGAVIPWTRLALGITLGVLLLAAVVTVTVAIHRTCSIRRAVFGAALCLAAVLALLQAYWAFNHSVNQFNHYHGASCDMEAVVETRHRSDSSFASFDIRVLSINGQPTDARARMTCEHASNLQEGDRFRSAVTVLPLEDATSALYPKSVLLSDGYKLACRSDSEESLIIVEEDLPSANRFWSSVQAFAAGRIRAGMRYFDNNRATLTEAMLLGDKSDLDPSVERDFRRAGVSHLLALSGLHVTLLFGSLELALKGLWISKKIRGALLILAATGYVFLTGCSLSVIRAVVMLSAASSAYLFAAKSDPLTSLGVAGVGILMFTPTAALDAGFWMSFSSTFGLIAAMPFVSRSLNRWRFAASRLHPLWQRVVRGAAYAVALLAVGAVAMSFSLWITALSVGQLNLSSIWLTVLLTPAAYVLLLGGALLIPFGGSPIGDGIGWLVYRAERWMIELTREVSYQTTPLPLDEFSLALGALMVAVMLAMLCCRIRRPWHLFVPMIAGWSVLLLLSGVGQSALIRNTSALQVTYGRSSAQSEALVVSSAGESVLVDLSSGSHSSWSTATAQARADGSVEWGAVILTDYHSRTPGSLSRLMEREMVRALWLPHPIDEQDYYRMLSCLEKAEAQGVPVTVYKNEKPLHLLGKSTLDIQTASIDRSTKPVHLLTLATDKESLVLCSAAIFESPLADTAKEQISSANAVVIAAVGPSVKQPFSINPPASTPIAFSDFSTCSHCLSPAPNRTIGMGRFLLGEKRVGGTS